MSGAATPEVTVVIPTRDRRALLEPTLASVLAQRDVELEVVVVDDGSRDDTPHALASVRDPRVRTIVLPASGGVSAARNRGIEAARGTWVAFLDDDDLWAPSKLAIQLRALERTGASWSFASAVHVEPGPALWTVSPALDAATTARRLPEDNVIPAGASNVVARRDAIRRAGGFDLGLAHLADWDMWLRLLRGGPPAPVDEVLVAYRLHASNMVLANTAGVLDELQVLDERTRDLRDGRALDAAAVHRWLAVAFWRGGRRADARRAYLAAVRAGDRRSLARIARTFVPVRRLHRPPAWPSGVEGWLGAALRGTVDGYPAVPA